MSATRGANIIVSEYQRRMRRHFSAAPLVAAPAPWRRVLVEPIGGLLGIGFGVAPDTGLDVVMVVSFDGHGLIDSMTGEILAREADPATHTPDGSALLTCPGLGALAGVDVPIAGMYGGGLHRTTEDGWIVQVMAPEWPNERVLLAMSSAAMYREPPGTHWWHVFHLSGCEFRAAGFSPSGRTMAVATSRDLALWTRHPLEVTV